MICISFLIIIFGMTTNCLSSYAFSNRKNLSSTNVYLTSLCIVNSIALLGILVNSVLYVLFVNFSFFSGIKVIMYFYPYVYQIAITSQFASIYLTMSVSINQFLIIKYSKGLQMNKSKAIQKKDIKRSFFITLTIVIFSFIFCLPYMFKFTYTEENGLEKTKNNIILDQIVHIYLYIPLAYVIPFLVLITTNTYLLMKLSKAKNSRKHINHIRYKSSKKNNEARVEINLTNNKPAKRIQKFKMKNKSTMLVSIVFFFLICQFPTLLLHLIETEIFGADYKEQTFYIYLAEISKIFLIINLSFNFSFFYLFSKKFRSNLKIQLCLKKSNNNNNNVVVV